MKRDHDGNPTAPLTAGAPAAVTTTATAAVAPTATAAPTTDAAVGFSRAEMLSEPVAGKAAPPQVHLFVVWGKADEWVKKLDEEAGSPLHTIASAIKGSAGGSGKAPATRVTAVEASDLSDDQQGDVLVFPHMVRLRRAAATPEGCRAVAVRVLDGDFAPSSSPSEVEPLPFRVAVMVCAHASRDARCGFCGPALFTPLQANAPKHARVYKCSHIGGHQYAGNLVLFRGTTSAPGSDKSAVSDWLSYVAPKDVDTVLRMAAEPASAADAYPPHEMHAMWRARAGFSEEQHVELVSNVMAACEGCCAPSRDMEDGVPGYPSPAVQDQTERKRFRSPSAAKSPKAAAMATASSTTADASAAAAATTTETLPALPPHLPKPRVCFILGPPGGGKGTMCSNLVRDFDVVHLSAGDLLRDERTNPESLDGQLIETHIREGKIVPVAITLKLIWAAIRKNAERGKSLFLVDGFPRNRDNLDGWTSIIGDRVRVVGVMFLDAPESVVEARLLERGKTSGRSDDNHASIKKRFATYANETKPILDEFSSRGMCAGIDASRSREDVYADVLAFVTDRFIPRRKRVVFVLGHAGAGKGSQCAEIAADDAMDATHLSAGDLLRAERSDPNSKDGTLIETYIKEGKIVPAEITVRLLLRAMERSGTRNVLVDGFPRNQDNLDAWERSEDVRKSCDVGGCLVLEVPEAVVEKRLLARGEAAGANRRSDDNLESIRKRFAVFRNETMPIVESFRAVGSLHVVDGNRSIPDVKADVQRVMREMFFGPVKGAPAKPATATATSAEKKTAVPPHTYPMGAAPHASHADSSSSSMIMWGLAVVAVASTVGYLVWSRQQIRE